MDASARLQDEMAAMRHDIQEHLKLYCGNLYERMKPIHSERARALARQLPNVTEADVVKEGQRLTNRIRDKLGKTEEALAAARRQMGSKNERELRAQMIDVQDKRHRLGLITETEALLRQLSLDVPADMPLAVTQLLRQAEHNLNQISKALPVDQKQQQSALARELDDKGQANDENYDGRKPSIRTDGFDRAANVSEQPALLLLRADVGAVRQSLEHELKCFWKAHVKQESGQPARLLLTLNQDSRATQFVSAMGRTGILAPRLVEFADFLIAHFLAPQLAGTHQPTRVNQFDERCAVWTMTKKTATAAAATTTAGMTSAFDEMITFLRAVEKEFADVTVLGRQHNEIVVDDDELAEQAKDDEEAKERSKMAGGKEKFNARAAAEMLAKRRPAIAKDDEPLFDLLGSFLGPMLLERIVPDALASAPPDAASDVLLMVDHFRGQLMSLGWDSLPGVSQLAGHTKKVVVDSRCMHFLKRARDLALKDYVTVVEVGDLDERTRTNASTGGDQPAATAEATKFKRCSVNKAAVDMAALLDEMVKCAVADADEAEATRFLRTLCHALHVYTTTSARHHKAVLLSVPQIAALFYNATHFLCHRVLALPYNQELRKKSTKLQQAVHPVLIEAALGGRAAGTRVLDEFLAEARRQLSEQLSSASYSGVGDATRLAVEGALRQLRAMATVWRGVCAPTVYCLLVGNLAAHTLQTFAEAILRQEDITETDGDRLSALLERLLLETDDLLVVERDGASLATKFTEGKADHARELLYCLRGSLQSIDDRWCDGHGPLAAHFHPADMKALIRALFANTAKRQRLLDSIG